MLFREIAPASPGAIPLALTRALCGLISSAGFGVPQLAIDCLAGAASLNIIPEDGLWVVAGAVLPEDVIVLKIGSRDSSSCRGVLAARPPHWPSTVVDADEADEAARGPTTSAWCSNDEALIAARTFWLRQFMLPWRASQCAGLRAGKTCKVARWVLPSRFHSIDARWALIWW